MVTTLPLHYPTENVFKRPARSIKSLRFKILISLLHWFKKVQTATIFCTLITYTRGEWEKFARRGYRVESNSNPNWWPYVLQSLSSFLIARTISACKFSWRNSELKAVFRQLHQLGQQVRRQMRAKRSDIE